MDLMPVLDKSGVFNQTATEILHKITMPWNCANFKAVQYNDMEALQFSAGKGEMIIAYNRGKKLYNIYQETNGDVKQLYEDVNSDRLRSVIKRLVGE